MDPLSALSVTTSVAQFITFAFSLVSKSTEIYKSASGATREIQDIESIYSTLSTLAIDLEKTEYGGLASRRAEALQKLSGECRDECAELLALIRKIKCRNVGARKWESFKAALKTVWESSEIEQLQQRLSKKQETLITEICSISTEYHIHHRNQLEGLRRESRVFSVEASKKLEDIENALNDLNIRTTPTTRSGFSRAEIESLADDFSRLSTMEASVRADYTVLRRLTYDSRPVRHSSISEAHKNTFIWALEDPSYEMQSGYLKLPAWLKQQNGGIFWISGKPGSGKSTLVKFIADNERTFQHLQNWSSPYYPKIISHYFWSPGTAMQRSQEGLLRSLLYEIFRQFPDFIETIWTGLDRQPDEPWVLHDLRKALHRVSSSLMPHMKICIFIDGLDEYEGDHSDLCEDLAKLASSPHIKLCVSSRPWNVFEDAFGSDPARKIYIHELTRHDIRGYVDDHLSQLPRWRYLAARVEHADSLPSEITERASGVFLWVVLVIKQLRTGLRNDDSFSDLQRRLRSLPTDLEPFFKRMLESVDQFYHEKMAGALRMALAADEPLDALLFNLHDLEYDDIDYALGVEVKELSEESIRALREQGARRLNARTMGLLETNSCCTVEFMHRTVRDYLRTRDMADFLASKSRPGFCPTRSLFRANVARLKSVYFPGQLTTDYRMFSFGSVRKHVLDILSYASTLEKDSDFTPDIFELIDHLEACIPMVSDQTKDPDSCKLFFREGVLWACLVSFISWKLPSEPGYFVVLGRRSASEILALLPPGDGKTPCPGDKLRPVLEKRLGLSSF